MRADYVRVLSKSKIQACRGTSAKVEVQLLTGISGDSVHGCNDHVCRRESTLYALSTRESMPPPARLLPFSQQCVCHLKKITPPHLPSRDSSRHLVVFLSCGSLGRQMPAVLAVVVNFVLDSEFAEVSDDVLHLGIASASALAAKIVEP